MAKNKSGYYVYIPCEYKGHKEDYCYDIPYEKFMEGVREYFDNQFVTLDGKDNDVWNVLVDLECLDAIFEAMEDWFEEHCKEEAQEEFEDYVELYYDDEEEEE